MKRLWFICLLLCGACTPLRGTFLPPQLSAEKWQSFQDKQGDATGMRGLASIRYHAEDIGRLKGQVAIATMEPAFLRFEVMDPLGNSIELLSSDGDTFTYLNKEENRYVTGPATACHLARVLTLPLQAQDIVQLFLGRSPAPFKRVPAMQENENSIFMHHEVGNVKTVTEVQRHNWRVQNSERVEGEKLIWKISYGEWDEENDLPTELDVKSDTNSLDMRIRFSWVEKNPDLEADDFPITAPPAVTKEVVSKECQ